MPLPQILEILLDGQTKLLIEGAATMSRKDVLFYDGSTYRNILAGNALTLVPPGEPSDTGTRVDTATLQGPGSVAALTVVTNTNVSPILNGSRIIVDDVAAAVEPRFWQKPRTRIEFWDGVIGNTLTMTVATVSGNATLTVSDNTRLTPGQAISGAGIPTGATILHIPISTLTTVVISHQATASASVAATLTGSNYVGGYWEDQAIGEAEDIQILQ